MGLVLVGVVLFVSRAGTPRRIEPVSAFEREAVAREPTPGGDVRTVEGLLVLTGIATGGTLLAVNLVSDQPTASAAGLSLLLVGVLSLGGFLVWGVHSSMQYRGLKSAQAMGVGVWILGLLLIGAVTVLLVTTG